MRFGVNNEAVNEPKLCFNAVLKGIVFIELTNVCHFKISKNQLKALKKTKKMRVFNEKVSFLVKKRTK